MRPQAVCLIQGNYIHPVKVLISHPGRLRSNLSSCPGERLYRHLRYTQC